MDNVMLLMTVVAMVMLVISCIEVGRNDATNVVNSILGAKILKRKHAILISGIFVVIGAFFASPVMDTLRAKMFIDLTDIQAMSVFLTAYLVNNALLFIYSAYGLPVSSTACLVMALVGGAIGAAGWNGPNYSKVSEVFWAILASIIATGVAAFVLQKISRKLLGQNDKEKFAKFGPVLTSSFLFALAWFFCVKGLKVKNLDPLSLLGGWGAMTFLTYLVSWRAPNWAFTNFFKITAVVGMAIMAFAFGQNDLANCAAPGISVFMIFQNQSVGVPVIALFGCGMLMFLGMTTKHSSRVTDAEINTTTNQSTVSLYAPKWCLGISRKFIADSSPAKNYLEVEYDPLRSSVVLAAGACIIATASRAGMPVSTTYVAFAAVVATGWADNIFSSSHADRKLARAIWVVFSWFMGGGLSFLFSAIVAPVIMNFGVIGVVTGVICHYLVKTYYKKHGEIHAQEFLAAK